MELPSLFVNPSPGHQVLDLASHFADGRLSAQKLREGSDQEVYDMLIAVKG